MPFQTDFQLVNAGASTADWTSSSFDSPTLNNSSSTTPIYIEATSCMWWPLKKGISNGYTYDSITSASLTGRLLVGWINYPLSDIANIPITVLRLRASSASGFTTNYGEWDALAQIVSPRNTPISGFTPVMVYPTNPAATNGSPNYSAILSVGWVATTGGSADGKQGGFDMLFLIGNIGNHSQTMVETFYSGLAAEAKPATIPGTANRPLGVFAKTGDSSYTTNVSLVFGHGSSDTASTESTETGKSISCVNIQPEHEISMIFRNPSGANTLSYTRVDCSYTWNSQPASAQIFTNPENADTFKVEGCAYKNGGQIASPPHSATRWIRNTKFDNCQAGTISNGDFTSNTVSNGKAITVTGDGKLAGTRFLAANVAADASALVWNGNIDPDTGLDGTTFTKHATTAHHAIEFGTASPLTMTLRNINFGTSWNASNAANDSTLHIKRTSGTVTINLVNCSGNITYKTAGAAVIVSASVPVSITVVDEAQSPVEGAAVYLKTTTAVEVLNGLTNASGVLSGSFAGSTPQAIDSTVSGVKAGSHAVPYQYYTLGGQIEPSGYAQTVILNED